jgi:hypothetical protein
LRPFAFGAQRLGHGRGADAGALARRGDRRLSDALRAREQAHPFLESPRFEE